MTGCKIGKVKMKNGGAPVYLINSQHRKKSDAERILEEAIHLIRTGYILEIGIVAAVKGDQITTSFSDGLKGYSFAGITACEVLRNRLLETLK